MRPGESCQVIAARNGISQAQFIACNPSAGSSCIGLWANANACVRTVGFVPPGVMNCYTTGKIWGDNQPAALAGVVEWCNGNSNSDGNGAYATAQTKYGCSNAQYGQNKLEFWIRNNFGVDMSLSVARFNQTAASLENRCARKEFRHQEIKPFTSLASTGSLKIAYVPKHYESQIHHALLNLQRIRMTASAHVQNIIKLTLFIVNYDSEQPKHMRHVQRFLAGHQSATTLLLAS
ncbi:hypothetical protein S40288_06207 [Stachybotrys chartarum IBT 40288]|nr:hypothetical protein S40288_06207 [Stachybotrys chartarum IBT 40288]